MTINQRTASFSDTMNNSQPLLLMFSLCEAMTEEAVEGEREEAMTIPPHGTNN